MDNEEVLAEHKRTWEKMYDKMIRVFWGLPLDGYAENGRTAYPKQWFKDGNI
jgi:hypothetical protein